MSSFLPVSTPPWLLLGLLPTYNLLCLILRFLQNFPTTITPFIFMPQPHSLHSLKFCFKPLLDASILEVERILNYSVKSLPSSRSPKQPEFYIYDTEGGQLSLLGLTLLLPYHLPRPASPSPPLWLCLLSSVLELFLQYHNTHICMVSVTRNHLYFHCSF